MHACHHLYTSVPLVRVALAHFGTTEIVSSHGVLTFDCLYGESKRLQQEGPSHQLLLANLPSLGIVTADDPSEG